MGASHFTKLFIVTFYPRDKLLCKILCCDFLSYMFCQNTRFKLTFCPTFKFNSDTDKTILPVKWCFNSRPRSPIKLRHPKSNTSVVCNFVYNWEPFEWWFLNYCCDNMVNNSSLFVSHEMAATVWCAYNKWKVLLSLWLFDKRTINLIVVVVIW